MSHASKSEQDSEATNGTKSMAALPARRTFRQLMFRLITPPITILLSLGLFEMGLRAFGYNPLGEFTDGRDFFLRSSSHPNLDYELTPGAKGYAWRCNVEVNRYGFRDTDYAHEKPPGVTRIVVIGDSITFGNGLDIEDTYPEVLERLFEESGQRVEVLNLGVGGYNTSNEVGFLEQTGLAFSPDVVIVGYCVNDIGYLSPSLTTIKILERYGPWVCSLRFLQMLTVQIDRAGLRDDFEELNEESAFRRRNAHRIASIENDPKLESMMKRIGALTAGRGSGRLGPRLISWYTSPSKVGSLRFAFDRLAGLSRDHDFRVVVVLFPYFKRGVNKRAVRMAYDIVEHEVNRAGFQFLDLSRALNGRGVDEMAQVVDGKRDPFHPNEEGNRVSAELLYEELPRLLPTVFGR